MLNYRENKTFNAVRNSILEFIDFFHPPFAKFIPKNTFRYLASGGSTFLLDIFVYYIALHFILQKENFHLTETIVISAHIMAFIIAFCVSFPYSFFMSKYVVFQESNLKGRIQLFRYMVIVGINLTLNYLLLKLLVEWLFIYPTPSKIITSVIVAVFSFIVQQKFTFGSSTKASKIKQ